MPGTRLQVGKIEPHEKDKGITLVYLQEQSVTGKEAPMPILMRSESQYEQTPSEEDIYDLFAASNYIGSIYGGHYVAYARHEANDENE
ncbi:unnamed protein product [Rotaria sp. Silwood1]|nr:unnamed protein product [Rotaria sp. Silwood1]